jgi:hypothetical protein
MSTRRRKMRGGKKTRTEVKKDIYIHLLMNHNLILSTATVRGK